MLIQIYVTMLASTQLSAQGYLGVSVAERDGRLIIAQVEAASPAIRALRQGDRLLEVAGIPVTTERGFSAVMSRTEPGERITMLIESNGVSSSHEFILGRSSSEKRAV